MSENQADVDVRIREKIARLRARLALLDSRPPLVNIIKGILDLLADEL